MSIFLYKKFGIKRAQPLNQFQFQNWEPKVNMNFALLIRYVSVIPHKIKLI